MTYNGGLGNEATVEEQVAEMESAAHHLAYQHAAGLDHDDVAQELLIKAWQNADLPRGHRFERMKNRARTLQADQTWTGHSGKQGKLKDTMFHAHINEIPSEDSDVPQDYAILMLLGKEILDGVELAYHDGEIAEAINALKPEHREYVVMRFWGGMSNAEIAAKLGRRSDIWERTWREAIQPKLRTALSRLATV